MCTAAIHLPQYSYCIYCPPGIRDEGGRSTEWQDNVLRSGQCLPAEKVDAAVRIECVVMDTSRIGTRVCIMYVCTMCVCVWGGGGSPPHSIPGVMWRSPIWDFSLYCCPYSC